jgi:SagB-type dehydrogenase family enzyme
MSKPIREWTDSFERDLFSISELFHENTKLRRAPEGWLLPPHGRASPEDLEYATSHPYKLYRTAEKTALPRGLPPLGAGLEEVLAARRSAHGFSGGSLSRAALSRLFAAGPGTTGHVITADGKSVPRRAAPSAGALYSNEIYLVLSRADDLAPGLYHYQPLDHSLEKLAAEAPQTVLERSVMYPELIEKAAAVLLFSAVFPRTRFKYGERGYRFCLLDCGHLAQNLWLMATALGLGAVTMGGFLDDELNQLLELDGVEEAVLYSLVVGTV